MIEINTKQLFPSDVNYQGSYKYKLAQINVEMEGDNLSFYPLLVFNKGQKKLCISFGSGYFPAQTSLISLFYDFGPVVIRSQGQTEEAKFVNNEAFTFAKQCDLLFIDPIPGVGLNPQKPSFNSSDLSSTVISHKVIKTLFAQYNEFDSPENRYEEIYFVGTGYTAKIASSVTNQFQSDIEQTIYNRIKGFYLASPILHNFDHFNYKNPYFESKIQLLYDKNFIGESAWSAIKTCFMPEYEQSPSCEWGKQEYIDDFVQTSFNDFNVFNLCETKNENANMPQCLNMVPILKLLQNIPDILGKVDIEKPPVINEEYFFNAKFVYWQNLKYHQSIENLKTIIDSQKFKIYFVVGIQSAIANYKITQRIIQNEFNLKPQDVQYTINYEPKYTPTLGCQIASFAQSFKNENGSEITFLKIQKGGFFPSHWTQQQAYTTFQLFMQGQITEGKCAPKYTIE